VSDLLRLSPDAWERYRAIRLRALADDPDAFGSTLAREDAFTPAEWRARLAGEAAVFLAVVAGEDAGTAVGAPWRERPGVAGLFGMWVAPAARGRGLGDRLVRAVISWARDGGFARLVLEVGDANANAVRLYERHGFVATGRCGTLPPPREHVTEHERALELR